MLVAAEPERAVDAAHGGRAADEVDALRAAVDDRAVRRGPRAHGREHRERARDARARVGVLPVADRERARLHLGVQARARLELERARAAARDDESLDRRRRRRRRARRRARRARRATRAHARRDVLANVAARSGACWYPRENPRISAIRDGAAAARSTRAASARKTRTHPPWYALHARELEAGRARRDARGEPRSTRSPPHSQAPPRPRKRACAHADLDKHRRPGARARDASASARAPRGVVDEHAARSGGSSPAAPAAPASAASRSALDAVRLVRVDERLVAPPPGVRRVRGPVGNATALPRQVEGGEARDLARADDLVREQHVAHAAREQRLRRQGLRDRESAGASRGASCARARAART